jgi:hypothetical protein
VMMNLNTTALSNWSADRHRLDVERYFILGV